MGQEGSIQTTNQSKCQEQIIMKSNYLSAIKIKAPLIIVEELRSYDLIFGLPAIQQLNINLQTHCKKPGY